jgi:hypothetical protein
MARARWSSRASAILELGRVLWVTNRCQQYTYPLINYWLCSPPQKKMSEKQQRLVLSIIGFLNQSIADGTVREEDKESLEVAGTSILLPFSFRSHPSLQFNVSVKLSASIQRTKNRWIASA